MPLRFPNPGSDIARMVNSYCLIHRASKDQDQPVFDLDFMTTVLTQQFQASSRGAVGSAARDRSADADRSRDPLYNQLKMYSEVYRMLGWLRPGAKRLEFSTTILGDLVAEDFVERVDLVYGLLRECLLAVAFPNPSTDNVGVINQRPFRWLLLLSSELDGVITRHEMILGLLAVVDDQQPDAFEDAVERVRSKRGASRKVLDEAVAAYASGNGVQVTTLENYTRLPVGVFKSTQIGWAESERVTDLYNKPIEALSLSTKGHASASWLRVTRDVREEELNQFDLDSRAHFANYAYYAMLLRAGVELDAVEDDLRRAEAGCGDIIRGLSIQEPGLLLYSPIQQANDDILDRASKIE